MQIQKAQKHTDPSDPDADPEHCVQVPVIQIVGSESGGTRWHKP
jgi:hypothetical protein